MKNLVILFSLVIIISISCTESNKNGISIVKPETKEEATSEKQVKEEAPIEKRILERESMSVISNNEILWSIYQKIDDKIKEKCNAKITIESRVRQAGGSINGIETTNYEVGWNNMDVILYIEIKENTLTTSDGLTIGSTKAEVIDALGAQHGARSKSLEYFNTEYEVFGILFLLNDYDIVTKLILYAGT